MCLEKELEKARKEIVSDGYDMSLGELMNLYRDKEIIIDPEFQRLFRWESHQKTCFIESLLLGIPIPPIFVFQNPTGTWELIDGLQRLSTVFEFAGILCAPDGERVPPSILEGTVFLPSLENKRWESSSNGVDDGIGKAQQLDIKRSRIRVEILKKESDPQAKYELFQRLNTGGSNLSEQEVRNCVALMINKDFHTWLVTLAKDTHFLNTISQTETALQKQASVELALRFFAFRNVKYQQGLDVHEYLNIALRTLAKDEHFPMETEGDIFKRTFALIDAALGGDAFKKWEGGRFKGMFLMSVFEVLATGISMNIELIEQKEANERKDFVISKAKGIWEEAAFLQNTGAGVSGSTRLKNLLPIAAKLLHP